MRAFQDALLINSFRAIRRLRIEHGQGPRLHMYHCGKNTGNIAVRLHRNRLIRADFDSAKLSVHHVRASQVSNAKRPAGVKKQLTSRSTSENAKIQKSVVRPRGRRDPQTERVPRQSADDGQPPVVEDPPAIRQNP